MRTGSVRVRRDGTRVISPLTEALAREHQQRLLDEARRLRAPRFRVRAGNLLVRAGVRLGGHRTLAASGLRPAST